MSDLGYITHCSICREPHKPTQSGWYKHYKHSTRAECITALRAKIAEKDAQLRYLGGTVEVLSVSEQKLRAALDQERGKVERLQLAAGDAIHHLEKARIWSGMGWHWNHLRKDLAEKVHALLSGRGEGDSALGSATGRGK